MDKYYMKPLVLVFLLMIAPVAAGLYGAMHDQISYTVSPEFFLKFRFPQFFGADLSNWTKPGNERIGAAIIGFQNTWKVGVLLGIILGCAGFMHKDQKDMFRHTLQAYFVTMIIAFFSGLTGLLTGIYSTHHISSLPEGISDPVSFKAVETMHNFSYMGGIAGMLIGVWWHLYKRRKKENPIIR